jgi:MoaA/NifB/PqqE/SkfB family radical SAM enzyme
MKNFFYTFRLLYFRLTHGFGFMTGCSDLIYKLYLNHSKVIHWRDGKPVYSLTTPSAYSKPAENFLARQFFRVLQNKNIPNLMSFAVNDDCNAACEHCSFYTGVDDKKRAPLTLEQSIKLVKDAQDLGVSMINFVGGEPTLREDLPDIIRSVNKDLSETVMFTNGAILSQKVKALHDAGLDSVYVSIDSANPTAHDRMRHHKGLFAKAVEGISAAKKLGMTVGISTCLTPEAFADGEFERMVELAKQVGAHELMVFDSMPTGRFKFRTDLIDNNEWVEKMIVASEKYNSDPSYPGVLLYSYATSIKSMGCGGGTNYFYVSPYGDVMPCDFNHAKFGNILEKPLWKIWENLSSLPDFVSVKWGGCKLKDSVSGETANVATGNGCSGC